jgi:hypothetical protein
LRSGITGGNTEGMNRGSRRVKLTVSLSSDLVRRIDGRRKKGTSRSAMFEQMLEESERAARKAALREELRAYYAVPETPEERAMSIAGARRSAEAMGSNPDFAADDFSGWKKPARKARRK